MDQLASGVPSPGERRTSLRRLFRQHFPREAAAIDAIEDWDLCPLCSGFGRVGAFRCRNCHGVGRVT